MDADNSGFAGVWEGDNSPMIFDNTYYRAILDRPWNRRDNAQVGGRMWQGPPGQIMLQTDIALVADPLSCTAIGVGLGGGGPPGPGRRLLQATIDVENALLGCTVNEATIDVYKEYIEDQERFFQDFVVAFSKMLQLGAHNNGQRTTDNGQRTTDNGYQAHTLSTH